MGENDSRSKFVLLTEENKDVLDFGYSSGYVSKILANHGCKIVGMKLDDAARASKIP